MPAGIRRLTSYEYDRVASQLLGREVTPGRDWPGDVTQQGFSRNRGQIVDSVLAARLDDGAQIMARDSLAVGARCDLAQPDCATLVVRELAERAFRRAPTEAEVERYGALFETGGIELVLRALLQSPNTLYVTELGATLDDDELANALAFAVSGLPPDDELRVASRKGSLRNAAGRLTEARRLLGRPQALRHYQRFVEEWLGVSQLESASKDATLYPNFASERRGLLQDTRAFVGHVMVEQRGSIQALLSDTSGSGRVGLLEQASFLAAHAHPDNSGPVLRGAIVLRRVLCRTMPNPNELGLDIVFPAPAPLLTTRERYAAHSADPKCAGCHAAIDAIGFTFEGFDAIGALRTSEADKPVDTHGSIELGSGVHALDGSADLARALAEDAEVESCLARQVFRFVTGLQAPQAEEAFVTFSAALPEDERSTLVGLVLGYVASPLFARRVAP